MKKRMLSWILVLVSLVSLMALPVSAETGADDGFVDVTISGIQDYDEINDVYLLVNRAREAEGLPALVIDPILTASAMQRAAEISVYYSHTRPNGYTWSSALDDGYFNTYRGENIAVGYTDGTSVMTGWMNSEGHRANILKENYTAIGIGCFYQPDGRKCWVQLFSSISLSDDYSESGKKNVSGIPIQIAPENLSVSIEGIEGCVGFDLYQGCDASVSVRLNNMGWSGMTPITMDGGYSLSVSDSTIAQLSPENDRVIGLAPGECTLSVQVDGWASGSVPVTVYEQAYLNFGTDAYGDYYLIWEDIPGNAYLFGKETNDELWTLFSYPSSGTNSYTHYGVWAGEEWTYVLRALDADQDYVDVSNRLVLVKLDAPVLSISGDASTGRNTLTWAAHEGDLAYDIYRSDSADGTFSLLDQVTTTSYIDTTAQMGQTYYYKVRATGKGQSLSPFSNVVSRTYTMPPLQILTSNVASSGKVKLTWGAFEGVEKYAVYCSTDKKTWTNLTTTTATSYTHTSGAAGTLYYYYVAAIDAQGNVADSSLIYSRRCDLPRPVLTMSNVASTGKNKISWKAISGAVKYEVYYSTDKTNWTKLSTTTSTSVTHTGAKAGTLYYYRVKAIASNVNANSAYSLNYSLRCDLARPTLTMSNVASTGKVKVSWTAITGAVKYEVYVSTDKTNWTKLTTTTSTSATHTSGTAGTLYYYRVKAIASNVNANSAYSLNYSQRCDLARPVLTMSNVASSGKVKVSWAAVNGAVKYEVYVSTDKTNWTKLTTTTSTSATHTSGTAGTLYYYRVKAIASNANANSAYSLNYSQRCDLARPVLTMSNVASSGKVKISWAAISGAVKYEVYVSTDKANWTKICTTTDTSAIHTDGVAGTLYYYRVRAIASNANANSAYSLNYSLRCDLPQPVITLSSSSGKVTVSWDGIPGAVKYDIYCSTDASSWTKVASVEVSSFVHDDVVTGTTYYYKVRAIASNANANSAYSAVESVIAE